MVQGQLLLQVDYDMIKKNYLHKLALDYHIDQDVFRCI
jgi:hypothetical protein